MLLQRVVPHAGTWIEIYTITTSDNIAGSFPTRERGLKYEAYVHSSIDSLVVPHAGTWIEIEKAVPCSASSSSFPTRERGLKFSDT